jgi:hypothetical protein
MAFGLALLLVLFVALAGCDSQPDPTASTTVGKAKSDHKGGSKDGDPDMVSAFSATHGAPGLVDMKFKITKRPAVGEPVEIALELIPTVELESLFARFQAADGLQIVSGAETTHFEHPPIGVPVNHKITVTAKADGIFYVSAAVLADSESESVARNFSFPLIVGQGLTEAAPAAPAAANVAGPGSAPAQP